jgi:hypothetical protein
MISFKTFIIEQLLLEGTFDDAKSKWVADGYNEHNVDAYIKMFKELRDKNQISGKEKDISIWVKKDFVDFINFVKEHQDKHERKQILKAKSKDAVRVFENDKSVVFEIKSYEASVKYGMGTKWCISMDTSSQYWNDYSNKQHINFYFIVSKIEPKTEPYYKIAVAVYPEKLGEVSEIYDSLDRTIDVEDFKDILKEEGIPLDIFKPKEVVTFKDILNKLETENQKIDKISEKWKEVFEKELQWDEGRNNAVIHESINLEDFIDDYGNDTAKWILKIFNGDEHFDTEVYEGNIEDCFNLTDHNKVEEYLRKNYPDDEEEWSENDWDFIKEQDDALYDECRYAAQRGEELGAENEMVEYLNLALERFDIRDSDDSDMIDDGAFIQIDKKWHEPLLIWANYKTIIEILTLGEGDYEIHGGLNFRVVVDEPHYGYSGFDMEGAKEYFKNESHLRDLLK